MSLLNITNLTHSYGDTVLYKNAELSLNKGEHMGVVGQNGAGKSTLIKICTEQVIPDQGRVVWQPQISIGYLDQYARIDGQTTARQFLKSAYASLYALEEKMLALYEQAAGENGGDEKALDKAVRCQEQLEAEDFYSIDTRVDQVASGLGLNAIGLDRAIGEMSGGQRAKVILGKLLLAQPDVLLLDEPTNFLDKEHVAWLAQYLSWLENAFLVVSHDYEFLDKIADRICDIDNQKLAKYYGSYQEFLKKKTLLREDYIRQYAAQQREIKRTEEFIRRNIAGRKSRMAKGRQKQLDRMDKMEALDLKEIRPALHFSHLPVPHGACLTVKNLSVGYEYPLLPDMSFSIGWGEKVVVTGFNGIGKSTLLKTLMGRMPSLRGAFSFSEQAKPGYFEQDLRWADGAMTPLQIMAEAYPALSSKEARRQLARCGVLAEHVMQPILTLSGGEQAKVKMCLLITRPTNLLILDEPTNHLDIQAKDSLKQALIEYPGSIVLVSHEEAFYRAWASRVIHMEAMAKGK